MVEKWSKRLAYQSPSISLSSSQIPQMATYNWIRNSGDYMDHASLNALVASIVSARTLVLGLLWLYSCYSRHFLCLLLEEQYPSHLPEVFVAFCSNFLYPPMSAYDRQSQAKTPCSPRLSKSGRRTGYSNFCISNVQHQCLP